VAVAQLGIQTLDERWEVVEQASPSRAASAAAIEAGAGLLRL
jgi:hypothetical protein